jgi:hypothetical protein
MDRADSLCYNPAFDVFKARMPLVTLARTGSTASESEVLRKQVET